MGQLSMGTFESKFADIIWSKEPIKTTELAIISEKEFNWKKTTTYTVLKRLCEKGIFVTNNSMVTSLMSRDEFYSTQSEQFVEANFDGSLPAFLTAFTARKKLKPEEIKKLREMIEQYEE